MARDMRRREHARPRRPRRLVPDTLMLQQSTDAITTNTRQNRQQSAEFFSNVVSAEHRCQVDLNTRIDRRFE